MGYCLGGTFLAIAASYLAKAQANGDRQHPSLASVTLLAAQVEFSEPGELGVFIDHDQLKSLREEMSRTGYFSGRQMLDSFRFLNSRDLIWSQITQRYLLGKDEVGIDMMSWNSDHTRLPERMHNEYLDHLFLNNALAAGYFRLNDSAVALMDIRSPMMVVGTARDHVSPWHSVYKIHLLCDTDITFVLAAGGHNAGIIARGYFDRKNFSR
jgi:polyhydroxyalkanoate synthase